MESGSTKKPSFEKYFSDPALVKGFYIPTPQKNLPIDQRKLALSPRRVPERESGEKQAITPETAAYLRQYEYRFDTDKRLPDHETPSPSSTNKFDESWPSTEKPSELTEASGKDQQSPNKTSESILSQYLRRFRDDPPTRRSERKVPPSSEFWWSKNKTDDSGYRATAYNYSRRSDLSTQRTSDEQATPKYFRQPTFKSSYLRKSRDNRPRTPEKTEHALYKEDFQTPHTRALLDKTDEIIKRNNSNAATEGDSISPQVTSSGVGSENSPTLTNTSSNSQHTAPIHQSTPEEISVRPVLHRRRYLDADLAKPSSQPYSRKKPELQENDVLYQWRLRRRLEQAKHRVDEARISVGAHKAYQRKTFQSRLTDESRSSSVSSVDRTQNIPSSKLTQPEVANQPQSEIHRQPEITSPNKQLVERVVQTDAETDQATTQTTPTIDPLTAAGRKTSTQPKPSEQMTSCHHNCCCQQVRLPARSSSSHVQCQTVRSSSETEITKQVQTERRETYDEDNRRSPSLTRQEDDFTESKPQLSPNARQTQFSRKLAPPDYAEDKLKQVDPETPITRTLHQVTRQRLFQLETPEKSEHHSPHKTLIVDSVTPHQEHMTPHQDRITVHQEQTTPQDDNINNAYKEEGSTGENFGSNDRPVALDSPLSPSNTESESQKSDVVVRFNGEDDIMSIHGDDVASQISSDGEYSDDEVLKSLRKQREILQHQLRLLDRQLDEN